MPAIVRRRLAPLALAASLAACTSVPRDVPPDAQGRADMLARFGTDQAALTALAAERSELRRHFDWARAQCFVQHAYSERHENERSGFVEAALGQAEAVTQALRQRTEAPPTALIDHTERMRPDLWDRAAALRGNACAAVTAGCLEVQLVRAGHEYHTLGWRHATSYFAIAEDLAAQADSEARACAPPRPAPAAPPAAPVSTPTAPVVKNESLTLGADVLFKFDRFTPSQALPEGVKQLDAAAARLKGVELRSVRVVGHTDPQGTAAYNLRLGLQRAQTVKALLVERGVPADLIATESRGGAEAFERCAAALKGAALRACNQPNRRVVIDFSYIAPR